MNNDKKSFEKVLNSVLESTRTDRVLEESTSTKTQNAKFSAFVENIGGVMSDNVKERIAICGDFLEFLGDTGLEHIKLEKANFCENRFCPQCSANKARKDAIQLSAMCFYIKEEFDLDFIFLTLTAPNVTGDDLKSEIREYSKAFERLFKTKKIKKMSKGYCRKLEVTYNKETDTYHPHYHVMIAVSKSYFTDKDYYISHKEWLEMWQKAKRDDTITQVDVRKFKNYDDVFKSIFELTKYIAKDSDYMYSSDVFKVFYNSLKNKRLLSFSGAFKDAVNLYKQGKLDKYIDDPSQYIEWVCRVWYSWNAAKNKYDDFKVMELTSEEKVKANLKRKEKIELKSKEIEEFKQKSNDKRKQIEEKNNKFKYIKAKIKDFETGEMKFLQSEKKLVDLKIKQAEFDRKINKFNEKMQNKKAQL